MEESTIRERQSETCEIVTSSVKTEERVEEENSAPSSADDEKEFYTIKKTFSGRVSDFIQSLIGNGYDLVAKPHTATWLVLFLAVTMYLTCFVAKPATDVDSIRLGVFLMCVFIIVFAANQFQEGPITRPHPVVWKIVLSIAVLYECLLLFILSLTPAKAREFMKFFDSSLGVPLLDRDYASDCRIYVPESPDHFKNVKGVFGDIFILAHFLGWIWKSFIFRDWSVLWVLSVWFEDLEVTAQHILPNFQECWWDKLIADVFGCNLLGMCIGMWINKKLAAREYNWVSFPEIKTHRGKAKRFLKQFSPISWKSYHWDIFGSFKSFMQTAFICVIFEIAEMNAFFLKSCLWIPPSHPLVVIRLVIWGLLSLPAIREAYDFFHDPTNKRLGQNFWTAICMVITECLIDYKMGEGVLYGPTIAPFPATVKWCWGIFLGLIGLWIVLYFIVFGGGRTVYADRVTGEKKWRWITNVIVYSIPIPMIYLLFWDIALKPHIVFNSAP